MAEEYDSSNITILEMPEGIRQRLGMFIGGTSSRGFMGLLKSLFTHAFSQIQTNDILINFGDDFSGSIRLSNIKTPIDNNWFNSNFFETRFNWDLEVLNAVSERFTVKFFDKKGKSLNEQYFEKGELKHGSFENKKHKTDTLIIDFQLDTQIWKDFSNWNIQYILKEIWDFAFLFKMIKFDINYTEGGQLCRVVYQFPNGLKDRIDIEKLKGMYPTHGDIWLEKTFGNFTLEAAFAFKGIWVDKPFLMSYVNIDDTFEEGSHVEGLLKGIARGLTVCCRKIDPTFPKISTHSVRESIYAAVRVQMESPNYKGSVRQALNNPEIVEPIAKYVSKMLIQHIEQDADWRTRLTPDAGILYPLSK
jgi:DNA gyrase/topoisomerase IV subunit B